MGTDINGFIECRAWRLNQNDQERWRTAIGLGLLYGNRDYDAFGCLRHPLPRGDDVAPRRRPHRRLGAVFTVMETLAGLHGDDGVRLVVWFDN